MIEIERGDASQLDATKPLWLALREYHASITEDWGPARDPEESWAIRRGHYAGILDEGGALFLARDGEEIVGLVMCEQEKGGGSPTWSWPPDFLAIVDLIVLPDARRRGAGEALMRAAEEEARSRGVAALDLMVVAQNDSARAFYEKHGFRADLVTYRKPL